MIITEFIDLYMIFVVVMTGIYILIKIFNIAGDNIYEYN